MKSKHEIIAIALMLVICLFFAACSQKVEEKLTDKATQTSQSEVVNVEDNDTTTAEEESEKTTESTTLIDGAVITPDDALTQFNGFYGSLYKVELNEVKDKTASYTVYDKNDNEYAKISLNLKTGMATEIITQTGEKNELNMLA